MQRFIWATAVSMLAAGSASATVVQPALGVSATEARIGGGPMGNGTFQVLSGLGTPGTNVPNYNPAGYFGLNSAAVSGSEVDTSFSGTNPTFATGSAAVDLNSGQIHLVANSMRLGTGVNTTSVSSIAPSATLSDVITVTGAITSPVVVRISMVVDGSILSSGIGGAAPTDLKNTLAAFSLAVLGGGNAYAELFLNNLSGGTVQEQDVSSYGGKVVTDAGNAAALEFTLYDDVIVTNTSRSIPLMATGEINLISPDSPGLITADFGNTARLQVSLPAGLGFTSQSGVFLTAPQDTGPSTGPATVPEPTSLLLAGLGLLGAALVRRSARG